MSSGKHVFKNDIRYVFKDPRWIHSNESNVSLRIGNVGRNVAGDESKKMPEHATVRQKFICIQKGIIFRGVGAGEMSRTIN